MRLVWPLALGMINNAVMQFVDRAYLAHDSMRALEAVMPAGMLMWMFAGFFQSVVGYSSVFVGRYHGAGDGGMCRATYRVALALAAVFGVLSLPLVPAGDWILSATVASGDLLRDEKTYYDITMHYDTTDDRITADIRHAEMPQYDENRAYTQLDYEVTDTIQITGFRNSFEIYGVVSHKAQMYTKLGYLDAQNQPQITDTGKNKKVSLYTLGSAYPYFDVFKLEDPDPTMFDQNDLYSNLSVLIRDWDIRIGGKDVRIKINKP